ncbi:MAG: lycopene cyclase family protein [Myxococcota bacterium]|nr:lycopene cyclase family protein [Myxococcota bacterium]
MTPYDAIVAGAGLGGLSFAWHLLETGSTHRILVIDRSLTPSNDKTWCFWGPADAPFAFLAAHSWRNAAVQFEAASVCDTLEDLHYHCIHSEAFQQHVLDRLRKSPQVTLLEADIVEIGESPSGAFVQTNRGRHAAPWVIQSVQPSRKTTQKTLHYPVRQHFGGIEIQTRTDVFSPDRFTMMDFRIPQRDGVSFVYILPTAPDRALVEHTVFSTRPMAPADHFAATHAYINEHLTDDYTVLRTEAGNLPMNDALPPQQSSERVFNVGIVGGQIKPSTGYAFARIQRHTRALALRFSVTGRLEHIPPRGQRFTAYDLLLLRVLHDHPTHALMIFEALFRNNPMTTVLRFLDEDTTLAEELPMLMRLPKRHLVGGLPTLFTRSHSVQHWLDQWGGLAVGCGLFIGWVAALALGLSGQHPGAGSPVADGLWIALSTFLSTGVFMTAHEAMHGLVLPRDPRINRWVGRVSTWAYAGLDYNALEAAHHRHHATPSTDADPDFHRGNPHPLRWYVDFMMQYVTWGQLLRMHLLFLFLHFGLAIPLPELMAFWAVPLVLSTFQLFFVGTWLPHRPGVYMGDGPLKARSLDLPPLWSFFACFHFGYHYEHHARPDMPWWRLWRLRGLKGAALKRAGRPVGPWALPAQGKPNALPSAGGSRAV